MKLREVRQALAGSGAMAVGGPARELLSQIDRLLAEMEAVREEGVDNREAAGFDDDVRFYREHLSQFLLEYKGRYIALLNKQVVDSDADFSRLAERVYGKFGYRDIFMPRVTEEEEVVNIPSPRLVAGG